MKKDIHPEYVECTVTCGCGNSFVTHAAKPKITVEICSKCHPFYTGKHKLVDSTGRVERFQKRWAKASYLGAYHQGEPEETPESAEAAETAEAPAAPEAPEAAEAAAPEPAAAAEPGETPPADESAAGENPAG
jgi:large subunit ribosomal protein L31